MPVCAKEITPEKIVEALQVIRDVCSQYKCSECPLSLSNGNCGIVDRGCEPEDWLIRSVNTWKAF